MLLSPKKRLAFRREYALVYAFLLVFFGLAIPRSSHAGLLSILSRLFSSAPAEVEERLPVFPTPIQTAAAATSLEAERVLEGDDESASSAFIEADAILAPLNPGGVPASEVPPAGQIYLYTVRSGDTLAGIAESFGVSVNTILWANNLQSARPLRVGDELVILPVTGVRHEVKRGDTVASIARRYRASIDDIVKFNGLTPDGSLASGMILIIPAGELSGATPLSDGSSQRSFSALPVYEGYYLRPIIGGRRSRGIHGYNGVDLAASCGTPVLASADGQVLITRSSGWNGGYGRYAVIAHPNGTQTLYAHLREIAPAAGRSVRQGELIGAIGSSGNSTGCHVHFEIRGARNPF